MNIENEIIEICERLVNSQENDDKKITKETEIVIDNGLDSLTFVNIIVELESFYGISLDEVMDEVCEAKTIGDLISIVEKVEKVEQHCNNN